MRLFAYLFFTEAWDSCSVETSPPDVGEELFSQTPGVQQCFLSKALS